MIIKLEESGMGYLGQGSRVLKRWKAPKDATEVDSLVRDPERMCDGPEDGTNDEIRIQNRRVMSVLAACSATATKLAHVCPGYGPGPGKASEEERAVW